MLLYSANKTRQDESFSGSKNNLAVVRRKSSPPIAPMMITAMGWLLENSGRVRVSNRVDVVGNWLDVQGTVQGHIYRRKQEYVIGESSQLRGVAWPCKCDP